MKQIVLELREEVRKTIYGNWEYSEGIRMPFRILALVICVLILAIGAPLAFFARLCGYVLKRIFLVT